MAPLSPLQSILLAVLLERGRSYGMDLAQAAAVMRGRRPSDGSLYPALQRLEARELVQSEREADADWRKGHRARRRFYSLTAAGRVLAMRGLPRTRSGPVGGYQSAPLAARQCVPIASGGGAGTGVRADRRGPSICLECRHVISIRECVAVIDGRAYHARCAP